MGAAACDESQERFMSGDIPLMVVTNAFGLGIDKPEIRFADNLPTPERVA